MACDSMHNNNNNKIHLFPTIYTMYNIKNKSNSEQMVLIPAKSKINIQINNSTKVTYVYTARRGIVLLMQEVLPLNPII